MYYSSEIEIIDLLARREAEFLRVRACEQEISQLLEGASFPFPPPPPLPSRVGGVRKKLKVSLVPASPEPEVSGPVLLPLRRLAPGENAFRLTYAFKGEEQCSFSTDLEFIGKLPRLHCADFRLVRVEAGCYRYPGDFVLTEVLWPEASRPGRVGAQE